MALRARGSSLKLLSKTESTPGTAATGNFAQLPCFSYDLSATQEITQDNVLSVGGARRDAGDPSLGVINVAGNARVPVDLENFGQWLYMLFGAATDSGSTDYTHTWKSGLVTVPATTQEKGLTDAGQYFLYTMVKAASLAMDFSPEGSADATIGLIAQAEARDTVTGGGTPTWAGMTRFHRFMGSIKKDASTLANVVGASFNFSNGLDPVRTVRNDLNLEGVDEGIATGGGTLNLRLSDVALISDAIAQTPRALELAYTISSTKVLTFTFPRVFFGRPGVSVNGPGGVELPVPFIAAHDASAGSLLTVVLKNQIAAYA